jgi:hypothetical protein
MASHPVLSYLIDASQWINEQPATTGKKVQKRLKFPLDNADNNSIMEE